MKKVTLNIITMIFLIALLAGLPGCAGKKEDNTLRVVVPGNENFAYIDRLEEAFPEIDFEFEYYIGSNTTGYLVDTIKNGEAGDLILSTVFTTRNDITDYMLDLSGYSFIGNIRDEVINLINVNDSIYQIPSPIDVRCIVYNKTLFQEYGWEVPASFNDLVALVKQIRTDAPGITPIGNTLTGGYPFTIVTTFAQCNFLSTPAGYAWENDFLEGKASVAEGFEEGFTMLEQLIDADAFGGEEYVGKWQCNAPLLNRECAMELRWSALTSFRDAMEEAGTSDEFGLLPFYGQDKNDKLLAFAIGSAWSINAALEEKGNEKKLENALKVMEWLVTAEAQEAMRSNTSQIAINKDFDMDAMSDYYNELMLRAEGGQAACMLYHGYEHIMLEVGEIVTKAVLEKNSEGMREAFIETADVLNRDYLAGNIGVSYGEVAENFTEEETTELLAEVLLESTGSDVALITHAGRKNKVRNFIGAAGKLYKGLINSDGINTIISKTSELTYGIVTMDLTGEEIEALLKDGKTVIDEETGASAVFKYYRAGKKKLEKEAVYKVAMQIGDYEEQYAEKALETGLNLKEMLGSYIQKHTPLTP